MSNQGQVIITLPGKQSKVVNISKNEFTFRHIQKQLENIQPDEFTFLYDEGQKKIVSKYMERLQPNKRYQLVSSIQLFDQWKQLNSEIEKFKEKQEQDRRSKLDLENQISQQKETIESKDKMLQQMNQQGNQQQEFLKQIQDKEKIITELKKENKDLKDQNTVAQDALNAVKKDEKEKQEKLKINNYQLSEHIQRLEKSKEEEIKKSMIQKQQFDQTLNYYYQQLQQFQQDNLQLNQYIRGAQEIIQQLNQDKEQLTTDVDNLKNKIKQLEQDKKKLQTNLEDKELDLTSSIQALEKEKAKIKKENKEKLSQIEYELEVKNNECMKIKSQLSQVEKEKQKLQAELNQKENQIQSSVFNVQQKDGEKSQLEKICNDQRNQIQNKQGEINNLEIEKNLLQAKVYEEQQKCEKLKKDLEQLKYECQRLEQKYEDETQRQTGLLQVEKKKFNQMKEDYDTQVKDWQEKYHTECKTKREMEQKFETQLRNLKTNYDEEKALLKNQLQELEKQKNAFLSQLSDQDATLLQKEKELIGLQNQANVVVYQQRIQRLVEFQNRNYNADMKFSIESIIEDNTCKFDDWIKKQNQQQEFDLIQIKLENKIKETLYTVSDLNYAQCATQHQMGKMKGTKCLVPLPTDEDCVDRYYLFKCTECAQKKELVGKYFGIKEWKKPDIREPFAIETAISNCLATLLASEFMKQYILELKNAKALNIFEPQFREQYLIKSTKCFRVFFQEELDRVQLVNKNDGFKFYCDFIQALSDDYSNDFFETIRQFKHKQLLRDQKDKKSLITDENDMIQYFIDLTRDELDKPVKPDSETAKLQAIYDKANKDQIRKQFSSLMNFIGEQQNQMPVLIFQTIQQIEFLPDQGKFEKFNGGRMQFDETQYGKFLSAFTYFSIIRSEHQLCVSHLQGNQKILYDPLVSTFDGFLDHQDQGYDEIRTLESKFLSSAHAKKGVEYARALGMVWK